MTRVECEKKIMEKIADIRKIFEEYAEEMRYDDEDANSLNIHISRPSEETEFKTWYGSLISFTEDADGNTEYILNAAVFDNELYEYDTQYVEEGVNI